MKTEKEKREGKRTVTLTIIPALLQGVPAGLGLGYVDFDLDVPLILTSCSAYSAYLSSAQA